MAVRTLEQEPVRSSATIEISQKSLAYLDRFIKDLQEDQKTLLELVDPASPVRTNYAKARLAQEAGMFTRITTQYGRIRECLEKGEEVLINPIMCAERVCSVDIGTGFRTSMTLKEVETLAAALSPERPLPIEVPLHFYCPVVLRLVNSDGYARTA